MEGTHTEGLSLKAKLRIQRVVIEDTLKRFVSPVVMWTGGKDSMLAFDSFKQVCKKTGTPLPPILFVDHGLHFPETLALFLEFKEEEGVESIVARNDDVLAQTSEPGCQIRIRSLSKENQAEIRRTGHRKRTFPYTLSHLVGNHLLKTVPMNHAIRRHGFDAVVTGIRWDESKARSRERFISSRTSPPHARIHPVLHFSEREVWAETFRRGLRVHPLYEQGFRSLDGKYDSTRTGEVPAWDQDLESTSERAGRGQDKENLMERLRQLGYM